MKDRTTDSGGNGLGCADPSSAHVGECVCIDVCARVCVSVVVSVVVCAHVCASVCVVMRANWFACAHVCASDCVAVRAVAHARMCAPVYLLGSTRAHVCVHVADVLPVALGHLDDFGTDFDELTATLLRCPAAALANRERDLVA